ncbi:MAG: GYD domain-containing protein [Pseudomonadota bacterium]
MTTFVMLTRIAHEELRSPEGLKMLEQQVMGHIRSQCPEVKWIHNYAVMGRYDYIDIFEAPDLETAAKVSTMIRTFGRADTEVWPATEWNEFKEMLNSLPHGEAAALRTGESAGVAATH